MRMLSISGDGLWLYRPGLFCKGIPAEDGLYTAGVEGEAIKGGYSFYKFVQMDY